MNEPIIKNEPSTGTDQNMFIGEHERPSHFGIVIGILIILLTLILIGLYMWSRIIVTAPQLLSPSPERPSAAENNEPESTTAEAQAEILQVVSTSDELEAIEADLEASNLEALDAELNAIDAELNAVR